MIPTHEPNVKHAFVLDEEDIWIDVFGIEHVLDEMDRDYLENVLNFLLKDAHWWHVAYREQVEGIGVGDAGYTFGTEAFERISRETPEQARHWMLRTTCVRAIMGLLA